MLAYRKEGRGFDFQDSNNTLLKITDENGIAVALKTRLRMRTRDDPKIVLKTHNEREKSRQSALCMRRTGGRQDGCKMAAICGLTLQALQPSVHSYR